MLVAQACGCCVAQADLRQLVLPLLLLTNFSAVSTVSISLSLR